jgi:DNA-binding MurR/RpiR family transcriptional regulator
MTLEEIMKLIEEDVRVDIYGDLYGHDRVAEDLAFQFMQLESEIMRLRKRVAQLEDKVSDMGWRLNPDRMGGQFSEWETNRRGDEWS